MFESLESAELPVSVLDILPNPVLIKNSDLRYVWVNAAFERLFGVNCDELCGNLDKEFFPNRQVAQCNGGDLRVLETGEIDEASETVYDQNDAPRETITRKSRLTLSNGSVYLVGVMHDVTDVVLANRALEEQQDALVAARDEADRANHAKSKFLHNMSHELRTPLNAVLGFAQILSSGAIPQSEEQTREYGSIIFTSGERLLRLVNDVLDLASVEAGKVGISAESFEPNRIVTQAYEEMRMLAKDNQIDLSIDDKASAMVHADPDRVLQVLLNLIGNAIKYNRQNGSAEISAIDKPESVRFSVRDTGPGIPKDLQEGVFQVFNRLGKEGSQIEGTGIGLSLAKEYVELMGGTIGFESEPDVGTTFWFELPLEGAAVKAA